MSNITVPPTSLSTRRREKPAVNGLAQYLFTLAMVVACYFGYLRFVVPLVQPDEEQVRVAYVPTAEVLAPPVDKTQLIPLLPRDAWELGNCQSILTEQGTLLFQKFEQQDDGSVKVSPFTLVSGLGGDQLIRSAKPSEDDASQTPVVLRCVSGAILRFNRPIVEAIETGDAKLDLATLPGDVDIYRPPTRDDQSDVLHVLTRNVQVDRNRIYTVEQVRFSFGPHRGSGRNLIIDLAHRADTVAAQRDFETIEGISKLELAYLDRLRIEPSAGNQLHPNAGADATSAVGNLFSAGSPLEVSCSGPFLFDFNQNTVTLESEVKAIQLDAYRNNITCDKLTLAFENQGDSPLSQLGRSGPPVDSKLEIRRMVAVGTPAVVTSNSQPAKFIAEQLIYDATSQQIEGVCEPASSNQVQVVTADFQVVTRHLRYSLTEDGSLGAIFADSPGQLKRVGKTPADDLIVTWHRQLATRRDPGNPQLHQIVLDGKATIKLADRMDAQADNLSMFINQQPDPSGNWVYRPTQVIGQRNVEFWTPQVAGKTDRLTVTWSDADQRQTRRTHRVGRIGYGIRQDSVVVTNTTWGRTQPSEQVYRRIQQDPPRPQFIERAFQEVVPSQSDRIASGSKIQTEFTAPPIGAEVQPAAHEASVDEVKRNLIVSGREIKTVMSWVELPEPDKATSELVDVLIEGNVEVVQQEVRGNSDPVETLSMVGDVLRIVPRKVAGDQPNATADLFQAEISSDVRYARISTSEFALTGRRISLDQVANKLGVHGAGKIKLSPENQPGVPGVGRESLEVSWEGGMIFNGSKLYFEHLVEVQSERSRDRRLTKTQAQGEALSVELNQSVDFRILGEQGKPQPDLDARELVFVDHLPTGQRAFPLNQPLKRDGTSLQIQSRTYDEQGKQIEQQVVSARQAVVDVQSRDVVAEGPGYVMIHVPENNAGTSRGEAANSNPMARFSNRARRGLGLVRVNFDESMKLNETNKKLVLAGRIRAAYQSVSQWNHYIDPDKLEGREAEAVSLTCQQMEMSQWQPRNASEAVNELVATGNVRITSHEVEAVANRVSYDESTDWVVFEGTARTDADLKYRQPGQRQRGQFKGKKFRFRVADQRLEVLEFNSGSASQR